MTYVAFLRGINVGGNNKVEMKKLATTFEKLGFADVKTFIASGNVIFSTKLANDAKLSATIEAAIAKDFKINIKVLVHSQKELERIAKAIPSTWANDTAMKTDVILLWEEIDKRSVLQRLPHDPKSEDVKYVPGAVIWRVDRSFAAKKKPDKVDTKLLAQMTVRNVNTVRKLVGLMREVQA